jgi:hypothetical protein
MPSFVQRDGASWHGSSSRPLTPQSADCRLQCAESSACCYRHLLDRIPVAAGFVGQHGLFLHCEPHQFGIQAIQESSQPASAALQVAFGHQVTGWQENWPAGSGQQQYGSAAGARVGQQAGGPASENRIPLPAARPPAASPCGRAPRGRWRAVPIISHYNHACVSSATEDTLGYRHVHWLRVQ